MRAAGVRGRAVSWSLALGFALVACGGGTEPDQNDLTVVATTSILGEIVSQVVGEEAAVEVLIPVGVDAHDFSPSARQTSILATADLVVANGLGLEAGLDGILTAAADDGVEVIELAPLVDPLPFSHAEGDEHDGLDPHFWMDPARVGRAALALGDEMTASNPGGPWRDRARTYLTEMEKTDGEIVEILEPIAGSRRKMITNHGAFGYFAARYGFEVLGVVIPGGSTLAEPSSAQLAELVEIMRQEGARVVFAETSQPTTLADAIAAELGGEVEVIELFTESLGEAGSGAETLSGMLITNAHRIADALG